MQLRGLNRRTIAVFGAIVLTAGLVMVPAPRARAANSWTVGIDCGPAIQDCIDAAAPGDTVHVPAGVYTEALLLDRAVSLVGVDAASTVVSALGLGQRPLTVTGADVGTTVVISGLTFADGDVSGSNVCAPPSLTTNCGGGVFVGGGAQPSFEHVSIRDNRGYHGGGMYVEEGSHLVLDDADVHDNVSVVAGGGISARASLTIRNSVISGNSSEFSAGGGISVGLQPEAVPLPSLVIEDSRISGNTANSSGTGIGGSRGGGISAFAYDVTVRRSEISGNSCFGDCDGGGLAIGISFNPASLVLEEVTVSDNSASEFGGGVSVFGQVAVSVSGSRFADNGAAAGGGLANSSGFLSTSLTVEDTVFTGNIATPVGLSFNDGDGGGLFALRCPAVSNSSFLNNQAGGNGGGVGCSFGTLSLADSAFDANTAAGNGGGVSVEFGSADVRGGSLTTNAAGDDGGAVWARNGLDLDFVDLVGNEADERGGAAAVPLGPVNVTGGELTGNRVTGETTFLSEGGGAIHAVTGPVRIERTTVQDNSAQVSLGGAIRVDGPLDLVDVVATGNEAGLGGAVLASGSSMNLTRVRMDENTATAVTTGLGLTLSGSGGAVALFSFDDTELNVLDSSFTRNAATGTFAAGGAIATSGPTFVSGSAFTGNAAAFSGGAVSVSSAPITVESSSFADNEAHGAAGGALSLFSGFAPNSVVNSSFSQNVALADGGAISAFGALSLENSLFDSNTSLSGRGGAVANSANIEDTGSRFVENLAVGAGGGLWGNSNVTLDGTVFERNISQEDGGGLGTNSTLQAVDVRFAENSAGDGGGGAHVGFRLDLTRAVFDSNIAAGDGGGLWISRSGPIVDSTFAGNHAIGSGGGLYHAGDGNPTATLIPLEISGSTLSGNTAGGGGGGVAVAGIRPASMVNTTVSGNATDGPGDGLSVSGGAAVDLGNVSFVGNEVAISGTFGEVSLGNVLLAGACDQDGATFNSLGGNLESPGATCGFGLASDQVNIPGAGLVATLQDNGGPTLTHALPPASPAVDAGTSACPATDQRGVGRDSFCDVGAFELVRIVANAGGPYTVVEGSSVTLDGSASSVTGDGPFYSWEPATNLDDASSATPIYTGVDDTIDVLTLTVTNAVGSADTDTAEITVLNAAPAVGPVTAPGDPVAVATIVEASAPFTDAGVLDTHEAVWDWGDGTTSPGVVVESGGSGTATGSHAYTEAGVYTVTVTVSDDDGGSDSASYQFVVVYDPAAGFVTGGGWIESEAGFCDLDEACAAAAGRANFGFVSRYKKGASAPIGSTEFNFSAGGLNFHSNTYDWLVVNRGGTNAQYKGQGTVNGALAPTAAPFEFMIWARDGQRGDVDTFRIRIWFEDDGAEVVVYDNGADQAIGGGNITVHG